MLHLLHPEPINLENNTSYMVLIMRPYRIQKTSGMSRERNSVKGLLEFLGANILDSGFYLRNKEFY